jgi:hypothetical protein
MLFADVMLHPIDAALQGRKVALDRVRGDANTVLASDVFFGLVIRVRFWQSQQIVSASLLSKLPTAALQVVVYTFQREFDTHTLPPKQRT